MKGPNVPPRSPAANPYAAHSDFPPPPRRTGQPFQQAPPFAGAKQPPTNGGPRPPASSAAAGANRYSQYTAERNGAQPAWRKMAADQQANFNAWEQMKKHGDKPPTNFAPPPPRRKQPTQYADGKTGKQRGGWENVDTPPPKPAPAPTAQKPYPPEPPPRGGISRSNTTRSPRKPAFFPGPGVGDEPAARNTSAYYNVSQGQRPQASRPQSFHPVPPPPPNATTSDKPRPDPMAPFKARTNEDAHNSDRLSTPYATSGGEKTYFTSEGLNRSASNHLQTGWQTGSARTSPRSTSGHSRHRSASPVRTAYSSARAEPDEVTSSESSSDDEPAERVKLNPKGPSARWGRRASADHHRRPHPEYPDVRVEEDDGPDPADARPKQRSTWSEENTNTNGASTPKFFSASQPASRKGSTGEIPQGLYKNRTNESRGHAAPPSPLAANPPWSNDPTARPPLEKSRSWDKKFGAAEDGHTRFERPGTSETRDKGPGYDCPNFFMRSDTSSSSATYVQFAPPPKISRRGAINGGLPPDHAFDGTFHTPVWKRPPTKPTLNQPKKAPWPYWAVPSSVMPKSNANMNLDSISPKTFLRTEDHFGMLNANNDPYSSTAQNDPSSSTSPTRDSSVHGVNAKFSSEDWHAKFAGDADYLSPQKDSKALPRGRSPPKRNAQNVFARSQNGEPFPDVNPGEQARPQGPVPPEDPSAAIFAKDKWASYFKESSWAQPSPERQPQGGVNKQRAKTPRKGSVASRKPAPATAPKPVHLSNPEDEDAGTTSSSTSSNAMDIDPKNTPPVRPHASGDPIANIIRDARPRPEGADFVSANDALNLDDLKETVPVGPSKSGLGGMDDLTSTLPFESRPSSTIPNQKIEAQQLELPRIPKAPTSPDPDTLTSAEWELYKAHFAAYLHEWNKYNERMNAHFQARTRHEKELPADLFLPSANKVFRDYQAGVEQDFRVRAHWEVSCEWHKSAVQKLAVLRAVAAKDALNDD
jgi:hypothetical protein